MTAASLLGDTFLYTVLPVSAAKLGLAPIEVGLALSLNRWIRLFTNPLAARLYDRFGAGRLIVLAIVVAAITTALYGEPSWVLLFLAARLIWGFSFSLLRLGSFLWALDRPGERAGRRIGDTRAIWGVGYLAGAAYAPLALEAFGWERACALAGLLTLALGIGPALASRAWRRAVAAVEERLVSVWEPRLLSLFVIAALQLAIYAGTLGVVGGLRIAERFGGGAPLLGVLVPATFVAGAFALTQRLGQVIWTSASGRLSDRSAAIAFALSTAVAVAAIAALVLPLDATGFVVAGGVAYFSGLTSTIALELAVARRASDAIRPRLLATLHTWQDAGAAAGALGGGALATFGTAPALGAGAILIVCTFPLWWAAHRPARRMVTERS